MREKLVRCVGLALLIGCSGETRHPASEVAGAGASGGLAATAGAGGESPRGAGGENVDSGRGGSEVSSGTGGSDASAGGEQSGSGGARASGGESGGKSGSPSEPASRTTERAALDRELAELADLDATALRERYPVSFEAAPNYDASDIAGLDLIQASSLALDAAELQALGQKGFVIRGRSAFPSFAYGYQTIYAEDLPVYISADSILDSVHRSYDTILKQVEMSSLIGELRTVLGGMRMRLEAGAGAELGDAARADADTFLTVASSLLEGQAVTPVAGGSAAAIGDLIELANSANGVANIELFGLLRTDEDFSQFKPRGHYTDHVTLGHYFRAMMWLGRIDFRLLETQSDGSRIFHRRQLEGMLLMNALLDADLRPHFDRVDQAIRAFVGEPDYMELAEVDLLLRDVGVTSLGDVGGISDQRFEQAMLEGGYGLQRISSHVMINGLAAPGTLPLTVSFAFLGQRYVIDSHVFSNVVYDRAGGGKIARMMPSPLDVAFAVLANDQAAALLTPELERYGYSPDLAAMRVLADGHPPEFWNGMLYNLWLGSLRELGPAAIARSAEAGALPPTFRSEAWGRRLLSTQLASWAQLRHDTILYAKQSYTGGAQCEFPDGYVDPYPEFYAKLAEYAVRGKAAIASLPATGALGLSVASYFDNLLSVVTRLRDMATHQRTGAPYTQEMLEFLNEAVAVNGGGCGPAYLARGWYAKLFFDTVEAVERAPTIADVHTQPFDAAGSPVGNVLHVGTGDTRLMVVVAETCSGPRAYAGLSSSYQELITSDYERLDDEAWAQIVSDVPDVPWAADLVTR